MGRHDRQALDDEHFIRHQLFGGSGSSGQRYAGLVLAHPSFFSLVRYELLTTLLSPIPGALGLLLRKTMWPALFPQIGKGVVFGCRVTVRHPERIRLGNGVVIDDDVLLDGRGAGDEGIVLGERVIINRGAMIQAKVGGIEIGPDSSIGADVKVISQGAIRIAENVSVAGGAAIAGGRFVVERAAGDDGESVASPAVRSGSSAVFESA